MSLSDSWQSFLDSCADKGLPFRDWAYALEDKGIPSLPVFAIVALLLVAGIAMLASGGVSVAAPKGKLSVSIMDAAGAQITGSATVYIAGPNFKANKTAVDGFVSFADLPPGEYEVSVSTANILLTPSRKTQTVVAGKTSSLSFAGTSLSEETVSLYVTIRGADSADVTISYESGVPVDTCSNQNCQFSVSKNKVYLVRAEREGYSSVEEKVRVGTSNAQTTLTLVKNGEEREAALHIGVFDEAGVYGSPIENASVKVVEAGTKKTLYSLATAQDGSCDAAPVAFGAFLEVVANAKGFESKTVSVNASEETINVKIQLKRVAAAENTTIEVVDENGAAVAGALVRVFDSKKALRLEAAPSDGVLQINANALGGFNGLSATVYKQGFLPASLAYVRRGANKVTLREATNENSGSVRVLVTDKNGLPASGASVSLYDASDKLVGIPAATTGEDGSASFEGVPAAMVYAAAAKGGRSAESEEAQVAAGKEVELQIQFVPQKAFFEAFVVDSSTRKPVNGASVIVFSGEAQAECVTSASGKCSIEIAESDAAIAQVTAAGYEDYASSEFRLAPGAKTKRELAITPFASVEGKMSFLGVFDEDGKRASELAPLRVYTARFSLSGSEVARAVAHVRAGDSVKGVDEEPIELISYSAAGASGIMRGVSYDELVAQQQAAAEEAASAAARTTATVAGASKRDVTVGVYDEGFVPQDVEAGEGARVVFKNLGATQHTVVFDQGFEGGAGSTSSVLQPNQTFIVTPPRAGSWSFHCGLHPLETGTLNVAPLTQETESEAKKLAAGALSGAEATAFKWVEFSFDPFTGRREISVSFKVKQRVGEKAWLEYRAAFYGEAIEGANESERTVRVPEDSAAGVTKVDALANTLKTKALAIKFGGVCDNGVCVEYWLEQNGVRSRDDFSAELGKTFRVGFHAIKETDAAVTLSLKTAATAAGGALALKQASLNGKTAATAASDANSSELGVTLRDAENNGFFEVEARRLSNDAGMKLAALDAQRNTLLEQNVFARVVSQGKPRLVVSVKPQSLTALEEKTVSFKVGNAFGTGIDDARIAIEASEDSAAILPAALEADDDAEAAARGEYRVSRVAPEGAGALKWTVTASGYAPASGIIPVKAPAEVIEVSPEAVRLSVRDEGSGEARIVIKNRVANELRVEVAAQFSSLSKYADVSVEPETLRLKAGESKEVVVTAKLLPGVPLVAFERGALTEKSSGVIRFTATTGDASGSGAAGTFGEDKETQFQVDLSVTQRKIDDAWTASPQSLEFELKPEGGKSVFAGEGEGEGGAGEAAEFANAENAQKTVSVENRGDYAVVVNQETDVEGVYVDPISVILQPGEGAEFVVTAALPRDLPDCVMQDDESQGAVTFYASSLGVSSKKTVALKKTIKQSDSCEPENSVSVTLPLDLRLSLPAGFVEKENADGSTAIVLPAGEMLWFDAGASAGESEVSLPLNTKMKVGENRASVTQRGVTLTLPVQAIISVPDDADAAMQDNSLVITAGNALVYLPAGVSLSSYENERVAVVPPNAPMRFERAPITDILDRLPSGGFSLNLPVDYTLILPSSARVVAQSSTQSNVPVFGSGGSSGLYASGFASLSRYQNVQSVVLQDGTKIAFEGANVERTNAAVIVSVPANSLLVVPPQFVLPVTRAQAQAMGANALLPGAGASSSGVSSDQFDEFALTLPFPAIAGIPSGSRFIPDREKSAYSYRLAGESVVQFKFDPRPASTQSGTLTLVRVPPLAAVFFFKGAAAQAVEDPTQVSKCPQVFTPDSEVLIEFPAGTLLRKEGSVVKAVMRDCSSNSKIKVFAKSEPDVVLYESSASKRVTIESGSFDESGDGEDGAAGAASAGSGSVVEGKRGKKITFEACEKDDEGNKLSDELKEVTITLPAGTTLVLPPGATAPKGLTEINLGGYKKLKLVGEYTYELSKTKKIRVLVNPALSNEAIAKQAEAIEKGTGKEVYLPPRSQISYVPYCDKSSSGTLEVRVSSVAIAFDPNALKFQDLTNANPSRSAEVCLKNVGLETAQITRWEVVGGAESQKLGELLPVDAQHMHFADEQKYGGPHVGDIPGGERCARFIFVAEVPESWKDKYGCIPETIDSDFNGTVLLHARNERGRDSEPLKLPVSVRVSGKDSGTSCDKKIEADNFGSLVDVSIAEHPKGVEERGTMYFKGVDGAQGSHKQFLTVKNNFYYDVTVHVKDDSKHASCKAPNDEQLEGLRLAPGTAVLFECKSVKHGEGSFTVEFKTADGKLVNDFRVRVVVYQPETEDSVIANLYKNTPIERVYTNPATTWGTDLQEAFAQQAAAPATGTKAARKTAQNDGESELDFEDAPAAQPAAPETGQEPQGQAPGAQQPQTTQAQPAATSTASSAKGTSYSHCEYKACNGFDALNAIDAFVGAAVELAKQELSDDARYAEIITDMGSSPRRDWRKVMVPKLTSTAVQTDFVKQLDKVVSAREIQARNMGFNSLDFDAEEAQNAMVGAGAYTVTVRLDPGGQGVASTKEFKERAKTAKLEVRVVKLADIPENIANLALLVSPNEVLYYSGATKTKKGLLNQIIYQQVGEYTLSPNDFDAEQAAALSKAMHGEGLIAKTPDKKWSYIQPAEYYSDTPFCAAFVKPIYWSLGATTVLACAGGLVGAALSGGFFTNLAISMCTAVAKDVVGCVPPAMIRKKGVLGSFSDCKEMNYCMHAQLVNFGEALGGLAQPGGSVKGLATVGKGMLSNVADIAIYGATSSVAAVVKRDQTVNPSLIFLGSKFVTVAGGTLFRKATRLKSALSKEALLIEFVPGKKAQEMALTHSTRVMDAAASSPNGYSKIVNAVTTRTEGLARMDEFSNDLAITNLALQNQEELVRTIETAKKTAASKPADALKGIGITLQVTDPASVPEMIESIGTNAQLRRAQFGLKGLEQKRNELTLARAQLSKKIPTLPSLGTKAVKLISTGAAIGLSFWLDSVNVDARPVRAEFTYEYGSHALAMHYEDGVKKPTLESYCYLFTKTKNADQESKDCFYEMTVNDLYSVCPQAKGVKNFRACLIAKKSPSVLASAAQQAGIATYTAVLVVQQPDKSKGQPPLDTYAVLNSVFNPAAEPMTKAQLRGLGIVLVEKIQEPTAIGKARGKQQGPGEENAPAEPAEPAEPEPQQQQPAPRQPNSGGTGVAAK